MALTFKNIELIEQEKYVFLRITGKLEKEDYDFFVPEIEKHIEQYGKLNVIIELDNFKGWTAGAAWEDTKFGIHHFNDIRRLAIIGDRAWEKGIAVFCKVFTTAEVRYFDSNEKSARERAENWVKENDKKEVV